MDHLDDEVALAFAAGRLDDDGLARALAHVDACADCRRLVATAAGGGAASAPTTIGRFVVEGVAGRGAMGVVYRARDPQLERPVAIKMLRESALTGADRARFEREARALARVDHPNVVRVYEVGEHDGALFLAMELVVGVTVEAWLAAAPRAPSAIITAFAQAGQGLLAAHQAGLVHRDFKPANVMVADDGRVRVTDFGLALEDPRAVGAAAGSVDALTRTGAVVGTPAYLAPELLAGALDGVAVVAEPRSDQFSFCVALYEALAGHRPFAADDLRSLRAAVERGPMPPRRPLPRAVHRALRRGLAVAPRDRFPSMRELVDAIRPRSRRPAFLAAAVAVVGAAAVGAVTLARAPSASRPLAVLPAEDPCRLDERWAAVASPDRLRAARAALIAAWPARPPDGLRPEIVERWDGLGRVRAALVVDSVRRFGQRWRSQYGQVCEFGSADARLRRICLDDTAVRLDALLRDPPGATLSDQLDVLVADLDRCTSHLVARLDLPSEEVAGTRTAAQADLAAATAARARGDLEQAAARLTAAEAGAERVASPSLLAEVWLEWGLLAQARGDDQGAIDALRTANDHAQRIGHLRILRRAAGELAVIYARVPGQRAEAERWLRTAATLDGAVPPSDAERGLLLLARASLARDAGDLDLARRLLDEAAPLTDKPGSTLAASAARLRASLDAAP